MLVPPAVAVLTVIDSRDVAALCAAYGLPEPARIDGIAAGSVNSNFSLEGEGGRVFLRLYEERDLEGAAREGAMLERLAGAGVPTPAPLRRQDGRLVSVVRDRPAALFPWREGGMRCQAAVTPEDARRVGEALARVHVAGAALPADAGRFGAPELLRRLAAVEASGHPDFAPLAPRIRTELLRVDAARDPALPAGLTHGDLFRDNVLWDARGDIAALLDFESACVGTFAYDLMVTVLAWCFGDDLEAPLAWAMREGYEAVRPLTDAEKRGLLAEAQAAALRFTVTRITDYAMRTGAAGPRVVKDWKRFWRRYDRLVEMGQGGLRRVMGV